MDGKHGGENYPKATDSNDSLSKSTSIASRLDRLETEINLLLMLSTKQKHKPDKPESQKPKAKRTASTKTLNLGKRTEDKGFMEDDVGAGVGATASGSTQHTYATVQSFNCRMVNKRDMEDDPIFPHTFKAMKQKHKVKEKEKEKEKPRVIEVEVKKPKRLRKKKSVCRCRKKRSRSNVDKTTTPAPPRKQRTNQRSKSAGAKSPPTSQPLEVDDADDDEDDDELTTLSSEMSDARRTRMKILRRSGPGSAENIRDLCNLVVDLNRNKDAAMAFSEQWKEKYVDLQRDCDSLKGLQEQTNAQKRFLGVCFQAEMKHRQLLEQYLHSPSAAAAQCDKCKADEEMHTVKHSLEMHRSKNKELLNVCAELRNELALSEERLKGLRMGSSVFDKSFEQQSNEDMMRSQASCKTEEFKKQIKEHLSEIEELRLTCAKNAEWACEESSLKTKLQQENQSLYTKVLHTRQREQKQIDQINILTKALLKIGKDNPKVKRLITALQKYKWNSENSLYEDVNATEAQGLISELNAVIQTQRCRIQELVDMTTNMAVDLSAEDIASDLDVDIAPSNEQLNDMEMARREVADVKRRYEALASSVRDLRDTIRDHKAQLLAEKESNASLQNEVAMLSQLLVESKNKMAEQTERIATLNADISRKDGRITELKKDLHVVKEEKNSLNKRIKDLEQLKVSNDRLSVDVIRQEAIISNLEKKFDLQRHEQVLQKLAIDQEKDQAMRAAQFATDKLMETMEDFRRQSLSQTKLRQALTKLLHDKDEQLRATIDKVSSMTSDPQMVVAVLKAIKPLALLTTATCQHAHHQLAEQQRAGYHAAIDVYCADNHWHDETGRRTSEQLMAVHSRYAEMYDADGDVDEDGEDLYMPCASNEDTSVYETPQLFTLPEEDEDGADEESSAPPPPPPGQAQALGQ